MPFSMGYESDAINTNMNIDWCMDYIHDCLRYEEGEKVDVIELSIIHHLIESKLNDEINDVIIRDRKFDTYDFFEKVKEDSKIMNLIEKVLKPVIDEEEEKTIKYYADMVSSDEEEELERVGFRKQTRIGECEGCEMLCEECENLVITKEK